MFQRELQSVPSDPVSPLSPDTHFQLPEQHVPTPSSGSRVTDEGQPGNPEPSLTSPASSAPPLSSPTSPPLLYQSTINPPQIQKVIVEHFIRSDATPSSFSQSRVRTFSGRLQKPNGEVDYDAWRPQIDLLLNDVSLSDSQKVRRILESLLSPAADIVKPLEQMHHPRLTSLSLNLHLEWWRTDKSCLRHSWVQTRILGRSPLSI